MSSLWLPLTLVGTFSAVALVGLTVHAMVTERRQAIALLRSQVMEVGTSADLRDQALSEPFSERIVRPLVSGIGRIAKRITPIGMRERIARKLVLAGNPPGWDADKV